MRPIRGEINGVGWRQSFWPCPLAPSHFIDEDAFYHRAEAVRMAVSNPTVSVVIPTKNRRELLRETIASVQAQTFPAWEAVIVDDDSADGTEAMVHTIAASDPRIRFVRRERKPGGASVCRNVGISAARGEYILFLDSDDLLAQTCLAGRVQVMEQDPRLEFAVFLTHVFTKTAGDGPYLWNLFSEEDDLDRFLRSDQPWHTSGALWRKSALARIGLSWDERALCAQDWEFHVRAIALGLKYAKFSTADSYWRSTKPGSISSLWTTRRHLCNRVRLYERVVGCIRSKGLLTERRRRILLGFFYEHAFRFGQDRSLSWKIWNAGRRAKVVRTAEFLILIAFEYTRRFAWRLTNYVERRYFSEWRLARGHTVAMFPASDLPNADCCDRHSEMSFKSGLTRRL